MRKNYAALAVLLLAGAFAFAQDNSKQTHRIPREAVKDANPVEPTPESIEGGKKTYRFDCAMCHGTGGAGKGDLAVSMKLHLGDFRDPKTLKEKTDGELFYVIKNGQGDMPGEGERMEPVEIWDLVNYIRSFPKKDAAKGKDQAP